MADESRIIGGLPERQLGLPSRQTKPYSQKAGSQFLKELLLAQSSSLFGAGGGQSGQGIGSFAEILASTGVIQQMAAKGVTRPSANLVAAYALLGAAPKISVGGLPGAGFRSLPPAVFAGATGTVRPTKSASGEDVPFMDLIAAAARKHGVDPALVMAVVKAESGFNPNAQSPSGAKGLMQLMDGTARSLGVRNSFDPTQNLDGGVRFLRSLLNKYGDVKLALAGYNAGPGAVDRFGGIPAYKETQQYISRVLGYQQDYKSLLK